MLMRGYLVFCLLLPVVFWLWMLRDCIKNEPPEGRERLKWIVFITVFGIFGALVYNVGRRKKRIRLFGK